MKVNERLLKLIVFPLHTVFAVFKHISCDTGTLTPSVIANDAHLQDQIEFSTYVPSKVTASNAYLSI